MVIEYIGINVHFAFNVNFTTVLGLFATYVAISWNALYQKQRFFYNEDLHRSTGWLDGFVEICIKHTRVLLNKSVQSQN